MENATLSKIQKIFEQEGTGAVLSRALAKVGWYFYTPFASLQELGDRCGTDKGDKYHTFKGMSYLHVYEKYFRDLRRKQLNVLEIGVLGGGSLSTWKSYFPNAKIFGLDIDPRCKQYEQDRVSITIGSQSDEQVLTELGRKAGHFDIIIDDGSHVNRHILTSFKYLFPRLRPGGIYIIEDLGCSYERLDDGGVRENWPGMKYNDPTEDLNNVREDMNKFFMDIVSDLDHQRGEILTIQFWNYLCLIIKADSFSASV